jgi:hypothetical protein
MQDDINHFSFKNVRKTSVKRSFGQQWKKNNKL